jgi:hypothetical protein
MAIIMFENLVVSEGTTPLATLSWLAVLLKKRRVMSTSSRSAASRDPEARARWW